MKNLKYYLILLMTFILTSCASYKMVRTTDVVINENNNQNNNQNYDYVENDYDISLRYYNFIHNRFGYNNINIFYYRGFFNFSPNMYMYWDYNPYNNWRINRGYDTFYGYNNNLNNYYNRYRIAYNRTNRNSNNRISSRSIINKYNNRRGGRSNQDRVNYSRINIRNSNGLNNVRNRNTSRSVNRASVIRRNRYNTINNSSRTIQRSSSTRNVNTRSSNGRNRGRTNVRRTTSNRPTSNRTRTNRGSSNRRGGK